MNIQEFFPKPKKPRKQTIQEEVASDFKQYCKPKHTEPKVNHPVETPVTRLAGTLMKEYAQMLEDGRIVKNVNTTDDVGVDEIIKQAKKVGFEVTRDGVPALLTPNGKSYKPTVVESKLKFNTIELKEYDIKSYIKKVYERYNIDKHFASSASNVKHFQKHLLESSSNTIKQYIDYFNSLGLSENDTIKIGDYFSVLGFEFIILHNHVEVVGFYKPKQIVGIKTHNNGEINYIKFSDGDRYPRLTPATFNGTNILQVAYFNSEKDIKQAVTMLRLKLPQDWTIDFNDFNVNLHESKITEIKMSPNRLQNQVNRILKTKNPVIGVELEICRIPDEDYDPNSQPIKDDMTIVDVQDILFSSTDPDEFERLIGPYLQWLQQDGDYTELTVNKILGSNPNELDIPPEHSFGKFLNSKGYYEAMDLYYDNDDWMEEPYILADENPYYSIVAGNSVAEDLDEYGITADVEETYHSGNRPADKWVIEPDSSIKPNEGDVGMELISPPLSYHQGLLQLEDALGMMRDNGNYYTNDSTGLHINVSIKEVDEVDYIKLVLLVGDSYVLEQFNRDMNPYTSHTASALTTYYDSSSDYDMRKLLSTLGEMRKGISNRAESIIGNIDLADEHISVTIKPGYMEFRSAGGEDYIHNADEIITTINRFVVAYYAASDPSLYYKEYAKKLYKAISNSLPATSDKLMQHSMQLFSMYNAGIIDKDELVEKFKDLNKKRDESNSSSLLVKAAHELLKVSDYLTLEQTLVMVTYAIKIEKKTNKSPTQMYKDIIKNYSQDFNFYNSMSSSEMEKYINEQ